MMSHPEAFQALTRMEARLRETRHNLSELERSLRERAEAEAIRLRPKMRRYNRRMSNWTGIDEETISASSIVSSTMLRWISKGCVARSSARTPRSRRFGENTASTPCGPTTRRYRRPERHCDRRPFGPSHPLCPSGWLSP
jgi:hypothetical protein